MNDDNESKRRFPTRRKPCTIRPGNLPRKTR